MKRTLMTVALAAMSLTACGGVDKEGTADNLITELEKLGNTFSTEQKDCIKDAVKSYTDDELRKLSEDKASDELNADFSAKLTDCVG